MNPSALTRPLACIVLLAFGACLVLALAGGEAQATEPAQHAGRGPVVGDTAPAFKVNDDQGRLWTLHQHLGKGPVVVYFYPAAMTSGCTTEACSLRDRKSKLAEQGVTVVGISGDSVRNIQLFKKADQLNFTLLSDPGGFIAREYGVPIHGGGSILRKVAGQQYTLVRGSTFSRWTFVLDRTGKIVYRNTDVNPAQNSAQVLAVVKKLQGKQGH